MTDPDLIGLFIKPLEYFRLSNYDRHLRDVAMILRISRGAVDTRELDRWIVLRDLRAQLDAARNYPGD